jgi:hypothetical protein
MTKYKNTLERFVYEKCYDNIFNALAGFIASHPNSLETYSRIKYPDSAALETMLLEFMTNVRVSGDVVSFDAVVSAEIEFESDDSYRGLESDSAGQWFRVSCVVTVEDKLKSFLVKGIEVYAKGRYANRDGAADNNLVPYIRKEHLDDEATRFLELYCPEALVTPMAVPIEDIVEKAMGLRLIKGGRLTDNFGVFGQICFSEGKVKIFDILTGAEREEDVERGTIIIDLQTYWERNLGCVNNTIAHEAFHWHRHRVYAAMRGILNGEKVIAQRCPSKSSKPYDSDEEAIWTDEDRMEWQANHVAPRILMPIQTYKLKIAELYAKYGYYDNVTDRAMILEW